MKKFEENNIFKSYLAEECFKYDVLEKIMDDYIKDMEDRDIEVTREDLENAIIDILEGIMGEVDTFLDEEF